MRTLAWTYGSTTVLTLAMVGLLTGLVLRSLGRMDAMAVRLGGLPRAVAAIGTTLAGMDARFDGMDARFDGIDRRLDGMDARFDGVDRRLDRMDARFDGVDERLDAVDRRFEAADHAVGRRFGGMDQQLGGLRHQMGADKTEILGHIDALAARVTLLEGASG